MKMFKMELGNDGYGESDIWKTIYVAAETIESAIVDATQVVETLMVKFKAKNHPEYKSLRISQIEEVGSHVLGNAYASNTDEWVEDTVRRYMKEISG